MAEETTLNKNLPAGNRDETIQQKQPSRPSSAANKGSHQDTESHQNNLVNHNHTLHWFACVGGDAEICPNNSNSNDDEEIQKEREERIKLTKERQNEERQRKLEELKAQALAAQKFREQKEEERRRRMEELRRRENDRRSQVEERRRAIIEADNERREYILRKNQEREHRLETKKRGDRNQIQFAFGSSTPRMIDDTSMSSSFWAHRRATSITNVAYTGGVQLTRRSSERELGDNTKKRATSASGLDRSTEDDSTELYQRGVNRRKTDLMPTIPSPRDSSRGSLGTHTPRTPGRAFSMTRLDQLAQPRRRNGEHIRAIIERERKLALDLENLSRISFTQSPSASDKRMSRSMSQLAGAKARTGSQGRYKSSANSTGDTSPMRKSDTSKSMSQLHTITRPRMNRSEKLRQQIKDHLNRSIHSSSSTTNATIMSTSTGTGLRSGEITPNSLNTSRPGSAMSSSTTASGVVYRRSMPLHRKPRPASIAVTGVSAAAKEEKPPLPKSTLSPHPSVNKRPQSASTTPSKATDAIKKQEKRASSARATPKTATPLQSPGPEKANRTLQDSLINKPIRASLSKESSAMSDRSVKSNKSNKSTDEKPVIVASTPKEKSSVEKMDVDESIVVTNVTIETDVKLAEQMDQDHQMSVAADEDVQMIVNENNNHEEKKDEMKMEQDETTIICKNLLAVADINDAVDMTASMIAKARINTEEEAKAALAERRRLAREEAERQAELERKRIEAEEEAELQKQLEEEERLRKLEEESIRLAEEQRRAEEERLQQAIEEACKREEEEKARREEEARLKIEREENEKKAREEAEKQRLEMVEKLKKEEKEREERRKRVEAIMSRTRAKGSATNTPTKNNSDEDKNNAMNSSMTQSQILLTQSTASMNDSIIVDQNSSITNSHQQSDASPMESVTPVKSASGDYEKSVTEKENLLLGSFNVKNLNNSNNTISSDSSHQPTTNGKSTTELIIDDAIISSQSNGHKNGSIDNNMFSDELPDNNTTQQSKLLSHHHSQDVPSAGQLIDFSSLSSSTNDDPLNFNNNNTNLTNNSNNNHHNQINNNLLNNSMRLVTSDSQDNNGDLSLL